ncbi:rod shape-determining protein MreC [Pseudoxanthomonas sacheonensis]|uniref:Cell shape-determining protein MreC n=1 Tax=Pseudoxanthomonas sacheonensis TaxID=443615 RepID=A0ABU1RXS8_9GAMM|nr:rod shape-determining protein MreC [Pseudoxanthomonas sacheonensis]MDR6842735.1 rod shape-determining protein MreC [Pseudoxanthomonas sacheonensis]
MPSYAGPPVTARPGEVASTLRLLGYLALAIALVIFDHRGGWLSQFRVQANVATQPLWWLAGLPGRLGTRMQDDAGTRTRLTTENRNLRNELLIANARLTRLQTAAADNAQLRALLGAAESRGLDVQLAPILNIDLDPTRQRLVLDAGSSDGVHVGQAVIDAGGLMGQVIEATPSHSTVLLLTDPDHAVPVVVVRNGVRLIVYGRGDHLELSDVPLNTDVKIGDVIVSSGLGGRFPAGFPVGTVTGLRPDDSRAFLVGELRPAAQLNRGRDVLLLRSAPKALTRIGNGESGMGEAAASSPSPGGRGVGERVRGEANAGAGVEPASPASESANAEQSVAPPVNRTLTPTPLPEGEGLETAPAKPAANQTSATPLEPRP